MLSTPKVTESFHTRPVESTNSNVCAKQRQF